MRDIPQIEKIIRADEVARFENILGRAALVAAAREETAAARERILGGKITSVNEIIENIVSRLTVKSMTKLQRVINCTGIMIHTNLGRSPLGADVLTRMSSELAGYVNLEFDIPEEIRGRRGGYAEELIASITGAEDAIIVNNNAASVFLVLNAFARGREAVVSRGELIQIGGGFRIPDIMNRAGCRLIEVGTTNITTLDDYRRAVNDQTGMIFSAHTSNFKIEGFTETPTIAELASLKSESVIFARDLGSGYLTALMKSQDNNKNDAPRPLLNEPTAASELACGADIICFSGDKLLGGCQAGIIAGRKDIIARLRKDPLMRILRVDKISYFILQEILIKYINSKADDIPLWKNSSRSPKNLSAMINRFTRAVKHPDKAEYIKRINTRAAFGGGSTPGEFFEIGRAHV